MKRKREKVEGMGKKRKEKCDQMNEEDEKENYVEEWRRRKRKDRAKNKN